MLFLLRNIRRKLMKENKITTYLLYAVGEILLVVIGILIAVKIESLNQEKQKQAEQSDTLSFDDFLEDYFAYLKQ